MWPFLTFLVHFLFTVSLCSGMTVRVDTTLTPESNITFHYWERVLVANDTKDDSFFSADLTFAPTKHLNYSASTYFVVYENNRLEGSPKCCTKETAKARGCKLNTLIDPVSYIFIKPVVLESEAVGVSKMVPLTESGTYVVELVSCEGVIPELKIEGNLTWKSSHGFLFPEEYPLILISDILAGTYFLIFVIFGALCVHFRATLFKIHYFIEVTLALYVAKELLWAFYYNNMNRSGEFNFKFLAFVVFIHIVAQMARLILMLCVSLGLGTSVSLVKTARVKDYDVINLGGFGSDDEDSGPDMIDPYKANSGSRFCGCFGGTPAPPSCDRSLIIRVVLFCVINFVFQYVDAMQSAVASYTEDDLLGKAWSMAVSVGVICLTLFFYLWVVFSLINTFRFLKGHPAQLRDYKLFLVVGITAMFLGVGIMGYTVYSKVLQGAPATDIKQWNAVWSNRLVWDIVTCFLLLSIAFIWNPYRSVAFGRSTHLA